MSKRNQQQEDDREPVPPVVKTRRVEHKDGQRAILSASKRKLKPGDYTVGWISPLEVEQIAALEMLDCEVQSSTSR
jgi:hypothetical protein